MKYGKVYFYDRMGNREPTESDKIREALDSFDAPRFKPPDGGELRKNFKFTPLETPPIPDTAVVDFHRFDDTPTLPKFHNNDDNDSVGFPGFPPRRDADLNVNLRDMTPFRMDDDNSPGGLRYGTDSQFKRVTIPDDPIQRTFSPPRHFNPIGDSDLPERILPSVEDGIRNGIGRRSGLDDEFGDMKLDEFSERYQMGGAGSTEERVSHHYDDYSDGLVCDQCRLEDMHMDMMRKKIDEEAERRRLAEQKAAAYEADCQRKEEEFQKGTENRRRELNRHIDKVNEEIALDHRRRRQKSPPTDYYIFRKDDQPDRLAQDAQRKEAYGRELEKQMEEKSLRKVEEFQHDEALAVASNTRAAKEFAAARDVERKRELHEKETNRNALEFQMEMQKRRGTGGDEWLWWAARPDEHGWREARMKKGDQVERNEHMSNSIKMLEDYKRRQEEADANARDARRAKYDAIRQRVHDNSELIHGEARAVRDRPLVIQPDSRVEAAWREAHEQNDKKYRVLQESAARSQSGAALEGASSLQCSSSCKRCIRCSRPLARTKTLTVARKERILPTTLSWHPA